MKSKCYPLHLLNNYLCSPANDYNRERYFTDYYVYLRTPLMRYIRYRLFQYGLEMETEDCWQKTFGQHSRLVSTQRIESAERLQELIRRLQPPVHDNLLRQKINVWTADIKQKIKNLMEFVGRATTAEDDEELARLAPGMNSDWHACKERGYALLHQLLQHYALLDQATTASHYRCRG